MLPYTYNFKVIDSVVCKIILEHKTKGMEHGSGVIVKNKEEVYIFTAKHCVLGKKFDYEVNDISLKLLISNNDVYEEYQVDVVNNVLFDDHEDTAIIVINKEEIKIFANIGHIRLLEDNVPVECFFRGYAAPYNLANNIKPITIGMCKFIDNNILTTKTKLDSTVYDDRVYNLSGCSGGGVFTIYNGEVYLVAIVYAFEDLFNRISINPLLKYNTILEENKLNLIRIENYYSDTEMPLDLFRNNFDKAKSSWLKDRYIPDLHKVGHINTIIDNITQEQHLLKYCMGKLQEDKVYIETTSSQIKRLCNDERFNAIRKKVDIYLKYLEDVNNAIQQVMENISGKSDLENVDIPLCSENTNTLIYELKELERVNYTSINIRKVRKSIEKLSKRGVDSWLSKLKRIYSQKYVIISGGAGTGKTHAAADIVRTRLMRNSVAILVQAKQYADKNNWKDILIDCLGLANKFSEDDIWTALENTALRLEYNKDDVLYKEKVLICIDGLDECTTKVNWINRINELDSICHKYSRLRFLFTSRPYAIKDQHVKNIFELPIDGDVKVADIFEDYINEYNITFEDEHLKRRIKWTIESPFVLKLFCEQYQEQRLTNSEKIYTTVTKLLTSKLSRIDHEINSKMQEKWLDNQFIVKTVLISIVKYFVENKKVSVECEELLTYLIKNPKINELGRTNVRRILEYLTQYGLIYSRIENDEEDLFEESKLFYEINIQPIMDYLIAMGLKRTESYIDKKFPEVMSQRINSQRMYALMLLEDNQVLVGVDDVWQDYTDLDELLKIQCFALSNVENEIAIKYKSYLIEKMQSNTKNMRTIVNLLIREVCGIPNNPYNGMFLNEVLMKYDYPVKRDMIWSSPENMRRINGQIWEGCNLTICSINTNESLTSEDKFDGVPLMYAWNLTSLDSTVKEAAKVTLTKWGIINTEEFIKMLNVGYKCNDPQMKEELLLCALGIVCSKKVSDENLQKLCLWCSDNIFVEDKIENTLNAVIRFCARAIMEQGYKKHLIEENQILIARPPYKSTLTIELEADVILENKESMAPVDGDLAWYVIKKAYDNFFEYDKELSEKEKQDCQMINEFYEKILNGKIDLETYSYDEEESSNLDSELESILKLDSGEGLEKKIDISMYSEKAQNFLVKHAESKGKNITTPLTFAVAAAISYIKKMGWTNEIQRYYYRDEKGEKFGYDIAICRQYDQATHGSRSRVMTTGEKYTWCAVHEIQGYLADRLPYYGYDNEVKKCILNDYTPLVDINNSYMQLQTLDINKLEERYYPYIPNNLAQSIEGINNDSEKCIKEWIDSAEIPDFKDWLLVNQDKVGQIARDLKNSWVCLFNYTCMTEQYTRADACLWVQSYIVKEKDYHKIEDLAKDGLEILYDEFIKSNEGGGSYSNTSTYVDPVTVTTLDWIKDLEEKKIIEYEENGIEQQVEVFKTYSKSAYMQRNDEEKLVKMPSKRIRDILDIEYTDGIDYRASNEELMVFYSAVGENWEEGQEILYANSEALNMKLLENGYKMFWIVKLLREPSLEIRDKKDKFFYDRYCTWIVTDDFSLKLICDEHKTY